MARRAAFRVPLLTTVLLNQALDFRLRRALALVVY